MMLLAPVPWNDRVWALPFLTVLAPRPKTNAANGRRTQDRHGGVCQSRIEPIAISAPQATVRDIYGAASTVNDGADGQQDGRVTIRIGGQPVYIEVAH
jgi:hypothetical protein